MRSPTVAYVLLVTLVSIGYAQEPGNPPEECKPYIVAAGKIIEERNARIDEYKAAKVESDSLQMRNTDYRESAQMLLEDFENILRKVDSTFILFDERGELLKAQISDYEKLSDVLYKIIENSNGGSGLPKIIIYAAIAGAFVVGLII